MNGCRLQNWEQPRPSVTDGRGCSYRGKKTGDCRLVAAENRFCRTVQTSDRIRLFAAAGLPQQGLRPSFSFQTA